MLGMRVFRALSPRHPLLARVIVVQVPSSSTGETPSADRHHQVIAGLGEERLDDACCTVLRTYVVVVG